MALNALRSSRGRFVSTLSANGLNGTLNQGINSVHFSENALGQLKQSHLMMVTLARSIHVSSARFVDKPKYDLFSKRKSEWRIPTLTEQQFGERNFITQLLTLWAILSAVSLSLAIAFRHRGY